MITKVTCAYSVCSPAFAGGADGHKEAELLRGSRYRGLLRWWLRTLDGFASSDLSVNEQEARLFGAIQPSPRRGGLTVRVSSVLVAATNREPKSLTAFGDGRPETPLSYVFFPIRSDSRAAIEENTTFEMDLSLALRPGDDLWSGNDAACREDLHALLTVFGHLGSIGFRGRRGAGALGFHRETPALAGALARFRGGGTVDIRSLTGNFDGWKAAVTALEKWFKNWRSYKEADSHGRADHDVALGLQAGGDPEDPVTRPTLGMPLLTKFGDWHPFVEGRSAVGRFASPVLLRPHFDGSTWRALVVFLDRHQWPEGVDVAWSGGRSAPRQHPASSELWNDMKASLPNHYP